METTKQRLESTRIEGKSGTPGDGPYVLLWLDVCNGRVIDGDYDTNGCPVAQRTAMGLMAFIRGRTCEQISLLSGDDLALLLGGLPEGKGHYADLAIEALKSALIYRNFYESNHAG